MNQNVQKHILGRFFALYGEPKTPNPEMFAAEYHQALKGYTTDALEYGGNLVIREHTFNNWPTVGAVVAACDKYKPVRALPPYVPPEQSERRELTPEEIAEFDARRAALADWARKSIRSMAPIPDPETRKNPAPDRNYWNARYGRQE